MPALPSIPTGMADTRLPTRSPHPRTPPRPSHLTAIRPDRTDRPGNPAPPPTPAAVQPTRPPSPAGPHRRSIPPGGHTGRGRTHLPPRWTGPPAPSRPLSVAHTLHPPSSGPVGIPRDHHIAVVSGTRRGRPDPIGDGQIYVGRAGQVRVEPERVAAEARLPGPSGARRVQRLPDLRHPPPGPDPRTAAHKRADRDG